MIYSKNNGIIMMNEGLISTAKNYLKEKIINMNQIIKK